MTERRPIANGLGLIVLVEPRDGGEPRAKLLPNAEALAVAKACRAHPERYKSVALATVFQVEELEHPA